MKPAHRPQPAPLGERAEPGRTSDHAAPLRISLHPGPLPPALLSAIAAIEEATLREEATLWGASGLAATLAAPHAAMAIAGDLDQPSAYCLFSCLAGECEILQIATRPADQRRGLGRLLLLAVLGVAADQGCDRALLEVRRGNLAARRLYDQIGFSLDGVRPGYYRGSRGPSTDHDALLLSCPLPPSASPRHSSSEHG